MSRILFFFLLYCGVREEVEASGFRVNLPHILDKSQKDFTMLAVDDYPSPDKSVSVLAVKRNYRI